MKPLCMIPARGGSKRCPGKNTRSFADGLNLLERCILVAQDSDLFDRVVVSSEDSLTLEIAELYGVTAHKRPAELASDEADTEAVIDYVASQFPAYEHMCCMYTQAGAFISPDLLRDIHRRFLYDFDVPLVTYCGDKDAGQVYWVPVEQFRSEWAKGVELLKMQHFAYLLSPSQCHDINTEEDWVIAEKKYRRLHGN